LLLRVDQVLLQGTQPQTQPLLILDKEKWSKYTSQNITYGRKWSNQYIRKSCGNDVIVQLLGLNVVGSDHKWWTGKGKR
jgi:hypothetical protein